MPRSRARAAGIIHILVADREGRDGARSRSRRAGLGSPMSARSSSSTSRTARARSASSREPLGESGVNIELAYTTFGGVKLVVATDDLDIRPGRPRTRPLPSIEAREARGNPPHHRDHRRRAGERRLLRRHAGAAARQEDGQPGQPDRLPPLLRRREGRPGLRPHLLRVSRASRRAAPATAWSTGSSGGSPRPRRSTSGRSGSARPGSRPSARRGDGAPLPRPRGARARAAGRRGRPTRR